METTKERLSYLAGLFDGEGCFNIQVKIKTHNDVKRVAFTPRLTVNLYYGHEALHLFQAAFGGAIYVYPDGGQRWNLGRRDGVKLAAVALRPHLVIKKTICDRYLEALSMFPPMRKNEWQGKRSWTKETVVKVAEIAFTLNPVCPKKTEHNLARLEWIKAICDEGHYS